MTASSRAHFAGLAEAYWRLLVTAEGCGRRTAFVWTPTSDGEAIEVVLGSERVLAVRVVDCETLAPVQGATVEVRERVRVDGGLLEIPYAPPFKPLSTDGEGWTTLHGLGAEDTLVLRAASPDHPTPGFRWRPGAPGFADVPPDASEMVVEVARTRVVVWPIVDGDVAAPPDGSTLRLRPAPWTLPRRHALLPPEGRVVGGHVVAVDVPPGPVAGLAVAPDGTIASLWAGDEATEGRETTFRRPRAIDVVLRHPDGSPAKDLRVAVVRDENQVWHEPVLVNAGGCARLDGLYSDRWALVQVVVMEGNSTEVRRGRPIGTVDLSKGNGRVEAVIGALRDVVVHIRVDGEPRFPLHQLFLWFDRPVEEFERDEVTAALRFRWRSPSAPFEAFARLEAHGCVEARANVAVEPGMAPIEVTLDLTTAATLVAHVTLPPDRFHRLQLQAWDEATARWTHPAVGLADRMPRSVDERGLACFTPLPAGRYRGQSVPGNTTDSAERSRCRTTDGPALVVECRHERVNDGRVDAADVAQGLDGVEPRQHVLVPHDCDEGRRGLPRRRTDVCQGLGCLVAHEGIGITEPAPQVHGDLVGDRADRGEGPDDRIAHVRVGVPQGETQGGNRLAGTRTESGQGLHRRRAHEPVVIVERRHQLGYCRAARGADAIQGILLCGFPKVRSSGHCIFERPYQRWNRILRTRSHCRQRTCRRVAHPSVLVPKRLHQCR